MNIFDSYEAASRHHLKVWGRWTSEQTDRAQTRLDGYKARLSDTSLSQSLRDHLAGEVASLEAEIRICGFQAD